MHVNTTVCRLLSVALVFRMFSLGSNTSHIPQITMHEVLQWIQTKNMCKTSKIRTYEAVQRGLTRVGRSSNSYLSVEGLTDDENEAVMAADIRGSTQALHTKRSIFLAQANPPDPPTSLKGLPRVSKQIMNSHTILHLTHNGNNYTTQVFGSSATIYQWARISSNKSRNTCSTQLLSSLITRQIKGTRQTQRQHHVWPLLSGRRAAVVSSLGNTGHWKLPLVTSLDLQ